MSKLGLLRDLVGDRKLINSYFDLDFDIDSKKPSGIFQPSIDLKTAAIRQKSFVTNSEPFWRADDQTLKKLCGDYIKFLKLIGRYGTKEILVPTVGIDLIWQAHMLSPTAYNRDCQKILGYLLEHDDTIPPKIPSRALKHTKDLWLQTYRKKCVEREMKQKDCTSSSDGGGFVYGGGFCGFDSFGFVYEGAFGDNNRGFDRFDSGGGFCDSGGGADSSCGGGGW